MKVERLSQIEDIFSESVSCWQWHHIYLFICGGHSLHRKSEIWHTNFNIQWMQRYLQKDIRNKQHTHTHTFLLVILLAWFVLKRIMPWQYIFHRLVCPYQNMHMALNSFCIISNLKTHVITYILITHLSKLYIHLMMQEAT